MTYLRYVGLFAEFAAATFGTIYFFKYRNTTIQYFLILLWYVFINDTLGMYLRENITDYNALLYNIYYVVNFSYLFLLYRKYISRKTQKKCIAYFLAIYLTIVFINGFYENYITHFQSIPYIIAACLLVITIVFYFIEMLNSEKVLSAKTNLLFWISVGLLLYFVGNIPFRILRNYYEQLTDATVLFLVNFTLTVVMNTCFIIGFIWSDKKQQY